MLEIYYPLSLIGTLNSVFNVVPLGTPFLQCMVQLTRNVSQTHNHINASSVFSKIFLLVKNYLSLEWGCILLPTNWIDSVSLELYTDSFRYLGIWRNLWVEMVSGFLARSSATTMVDKSPWDTCVIASIFGAFKTEF